MKTLRYTLCDVFTSVPLQGNALAVFTGAAGLDDRTLQAIAREMNLSETVFVLPPEGEGQARLRIFTPEEELPFAGHPILGAAGVIGRTVTVDVLSLETGRGLVPVALGREGADVRSGRMLQPTPSVHLFEQGEAVLRALGLASAALPIELYDNGPRHVMVAASGLDEVRALRPNLTALEGVHSGSVSVFAKQEAPGRFETRVFVPALGVSEDPATGSAAGPLALHCVRHGWAESGQWVDISQGQAICRPSHLLARVTGPGEAPEAVEVEGELVIVGRGELRL